MQNVVSLQSDRPRPLRTFGVPPSGARILFFTGVRYVRDDDRDGLDAARDGAGQGGHAAGAEGAHGLRASPRPLDAVAH